MFEVISQKEYIPTLPWHVTFLLVLLIIFCLFASIAYFYFGFHFFKDRSYLLAFAAISFSISLIIVGVNFVQNTLNNYKEIEYIAKIHDSASYNSITKNYFIIPQKDGTVILRPIEGD